MYGAIRPTQHLTCSSEAKRQRRGNPRRFQLSAGLVILFLLLLVLPMSPDEVELAAPPAPPVLVPERPVVGAPGSPGLVIRAARVGEQRAVEWNWV